MRYYFSLILLTLIALYRVNTFCFKGDIDCTKPPQEEMFLSKYFDGFRTTLKEIAQQVLPSPHSELLLGMTIGLDELNKVPEFKENLKKTGTIHVVVVSGFNISLVFGLVVSFLGSKFKVKNLLIAEIFTFMYSVLSGFQPPVIRAWIMGSIAAIGKYYGRSLDVLRVLFLSGILMVLASPYQLFSLSFQLSFLATLGLAMFGNTFSKIFSNKPILEDLSATLSAQVFVWPLIAYHFGTFSVLSPLTNTLILWTVPIATTYGFVVFVLGYINLTLGRIGAYLLFPFLDLFVAVVDFFSSFSFVQATVQISEKFLVIYLIVAFVFGLKNGKK